MPRNAALAEVLRLVSTLVTLPKGGMAEEDDLCLREIRDAAASLRRAVARTGRRQADSRDALTGERRMLTPRERQIVRLLLLGKSYKEIATELDMSFSTAQSRVKGIYAKLGVHSKVELGNFLPQNAVATEPNSKLAAGS